MYWLQKPSHRNPGFSLWITLYWYIGGTIKFHYILEREACNFQKYKTQFNIWYIIIDIMFCKRDHASICVYFFQIGGNTTVIGNGFLHCIIFSSLYIFPKGYHNLVLNNNVPSHLREGNKMVRDNKAST